MSFSKFNVNGAEFQSSQSTLTGREIIGHVGAVTPGWVLVLCGNTVDTPIGPDDLVDVNGHDFAYVPAGTGG